MTEWLLKCLLLNASDTTPCWSMANTSLWQEILRNFARFFTASKFRIESLSLFPSILCDFGSFISRQAWNFYDFTWEWQIKLFPLSNYRFIRNEMPNNSWMFIRIRIVQLNFSIRISISFNLTSQLPQSQRNTASRSHSTWLVQSRIKLSWWRQQSTAEWSGVNAWPRTTLWAVGRRC